MKEIVFNSPGGRIEGKYYQAENPNSPAALILHPHSLHGGTMNNKVVHTIANTFIRNKFSVLCFNFRGVGKSSGVFDHGVGELLDAATALDWLQNNNPSASTYWVAGFSFGAWIGLQLLMRRPEIGGFVAVAPPVSLYDFNFISPCPIHGMIIQGEADKIVPEESVYKFYEKLDKQRSSEIDYVVLNGADHFFKNKLNALDNTLNSYLEDNAKHEFSPKKHKRDRRRRQNATKE